MKLWLVLDGGGGYCDIFTICIAVGSPGSGPKSLNPGFSALVLLSLGPGSFLLVGTVLYTVDIEKHSCIQLDRCHLTTPRGDN
jgi:hypothetical protein